MDKKTFNLERTIRFHLKQKDTLVFRGWYPDDDPGQQQIVLYLDSQKLPHSLELKKGVPIRQKYLHYHQNIGKEFVYKVALPPNWTEHQAVRVMAEEDGRQRVIASLKVSKLQRKRAEVEYYIETQTIADTHLTITGWAIDAEPVDIQLYDGNNRCEGAVVTRTYRRDISDVYEEAEKGYPSGFKIEAPIPQGNQIKVVFQAGEKESIYRTTQKVIINGKNPVVHQLEKGIDYFKKNGMDATFNRIKVKVFHQKDTFTYEKWLEKNQITQQELDAQRQEKFSCAPLFSIVIPLYRTKENYLRAMLDSICRQTYSNWEICLADGSGPEHALASIVKEYQEKYGNIKYKLLAENMGISENTNAAMEMAAGDYIVLGDHDDVLADQALYECARALNEAMDSGGKPIDVIYSDEDKIDMAGKKYFDPHFKSDFNIDLLCSMNYICHLFVVSRGIVESVGMLRREFDGAQDHDFILRCVEAAEQVYHIPKVLYHWRCHMDSTASNPESKLYAFEAGRKAVEEHYRRMGIPATAAHSTFYGMFRTKYHWKEQPLISIIIPNKDHVEDLEKCMKSIEEKSAYRNFEFIIVENNSTEPETDAYYESIRDKEYVSVVRYEGEFNFSKINNFGAQYARGEYLLLLNNDTEIISPECLEELLGCCMREDVGIVGAKLCYEDDTIQHAGVVIGFSGMAGHAFIESSRYDTGYMGRIICAQDYSAVTAACMMTKKSVYEAVGGLTEELQVAFNDIDYCLKVRELGKLVVYNPYAELYHYESKSRGMEDTPEKIERFNSEVAWFMERWEDILQNGDPYYNPNLTLDKADFSLKM